ncbi:alpha/beta hydrolase [Salinibacter sp. 10B]|uniref:alpha/beta hydrolase n=1 Tax=Salinibacter sp. 10B TaxID=1923971 RepID=UPI000CF37219|nr:alpha/beta hydrolase [Salinibacter sp. 10B]PQJ35007.1 alpha/beta hydrolase [Salinibacter sp. 10B]
MRRTMINTALAIAVGYGAIVGLAFAFQDQLLFQPSSRLLATPDEAGMDYETVHVSTEDGETLHGWWIPAADTSRETSPGEFAKQTLLFFHGNAGNISGRLESVQQFHRLGLNVLIVDYRGYGQSTGSPSEEGIYRDAEACWEYLTEAQNLVPQEIIVFGRSMGGGPATWLAARLSPGAVILESVFTNVPDIGAHHYSFLPVRALATNQFDNESRVAEIDAPKLHIHSREDRVVPFELGRQVYEAAAEPKQFLEIQGGHNDGFLVSAETYLRTIDDFLAEHLDSGKK